MSFNVSTDQILEFNAALEAEARVIVDGFADGTVEPEARAVEARMAALLARFPAMPPGTPVAFVYGAHVRTVFAWQELPSLETGLTISPCDHFLGAIQAAPPHPAKAFISFWYCDAANTVSSVGPDGVNRALVGDMYEALNAARDINEFNKLPLDLCVAARLARRKFSN